MNIKLLQLCYYVSKCLIHHLVFGNVQHIVQIIHLRSNIGYVKKEKGIDTFSKVHILVYKMQEPKNIVLQKNPQCRCIFNGIVSKNFGTQLNKRIILRVRFVQLHQN